jgi:hypothetical protein
MAAYAKRPGGVKGRSFTGTAETARMASGNSDGASGRIRVTSFTCYSLTGGEEAPEVKSEGKDPLIASHDGCVRFGKKAGASGV